LIAELVTFKHVSADVIAHRPKARQGDSGSDIEARSVAR